jgi:hypothetical protein
MRISTDVEVIGSTTELVASDAMEAEVIEASIVGPASKADERDKMVSVLREVLATFTREL